MLLCSIAVSAGMAERVQPMLPYAENILKPYLAQVGFVLPMSVQLDLMDMGETMFVVVTPQGKVQVTQKSEGRPDLLIVTTQGLMEKLISAGGDMNKVTPIVNDNQDFVVKGYGFKGGTLVNQAENMLKVKFRQPEVKDAVQGVAGAVAEVADVGISFVGTVVGLIGKILPFKLW